MARTKFCELRDAVVAKPGAAERLAGLRADTLDEIRLYELRHGEAISQAELAGRLDVTQGAISKLCGSTSKRSAPAWSSSLCSTTTTVGCPSTSAATTQPDRRLSAPCQHDSHPPVQTNLVPPLGSSRVQQSYNATSTNGLLPTHTNGPYAGSDSLVEQGKHL